MIMKKKIALVSAFVLLSSCGVDTGETDGGSESNVSTRDDRRVVLFLGTSLTAGLGLNEDQAYPALIQSKIDSVRLDFRVLNSGVSGETSAGGLRRIDWLLRNPVDVLVVELGANDGLRGQDVDALKANLGEIVDRTRAVYPDARVAIVGMEAPPNFGQDYTDRFRAVFTEVAAEKAAVFIPFLLDGVAGVDSLNQQDGIHPTARGQEIVADNIWEELLPVLVDRADK